MKNLYKANMLRLFKDKLYYAGLILAAVMTYSISLGNMELLKMHNISHNECMKLISGAVYCFIGIYAAVFQGIEFSDGVIRNKITMGYTKKQIYISHLLVSFSMMVIMEIVWFISGLAAGGTVDRDLIGYAFSMMFSMFSYCAFMTFLSFITRKPAAAGGFGTVLFYALFTLCLITNYLYAFLSEKAATKIIVLFENVNAVGQWFLNTIFASTEVSSGGYPNSYGIPAQILISIALVILFTLLGTHKLSKQDIN